MLLDPKRTADPRDNLDKATRRELVDWARVNGLAEVTEAMPADDIEGKSGTGIRNLLRAKGLSRIPIPHRSINQHGTIRTRALKAQQQQQPSPPAATADEWAEFQEFKRWKAARSALPEPAQPAAEKPVAEMTIAELRTAAKARGISLGRRDNMETIRAKLRGENPPQ